MKSLFFLLLTVTAAVAAPPNIVFIITDDQGYGDLAAHGNPAVETPHLDRLRAQSLTLTDYHVAPTCSPSRASLLTGQWSNRTGVWHTIGSRSILSGQKTSIATLLKQAGYATGLFGKWHLGDHFPSRPQDHGFQEVYAHLGGGVGQTPDAWDNGYFNDTYQHNGREVISEGFCTDVFFQQATRWISQCAQQKKPFFAYISTNAPHTPLHCPQKYLDLYPDLSPHLAAFYGMISNIDERTGDLRQFLDQHGLTENTLFIFTTDNGTAGDRNFYNAGMSGGKGSALEGGHRVPFFLHWPKGGFSQLRPVDSLTHAVDVLPTLLDLCSVKPPEGLQLDGVNFLNLPPESDRILITDSQRLQQPVKWRRTAVMQRKWRLIDGKQLFHLTQDPLQKENLASRFPEKVAELTRFYEQWWEELSPGFAQEARIPIGPAQNSPLSLTAHDWIQDHEPAWNQRQIRAALAGSGGYWALQVLQPGSYQIELRRWPASLDHPINASLASGPPVTGPEPAFRTRFGEALSVGKATVTLNGRSLPAASVNPTDRAVTFTTTLEEGPLDLKATFISPDGQTKTGAYYVTLKKAP